MANPDVLRTPDERFAKLGFWKYQPHYLDDLPGCEGLRLHYVDEGPADAAEVFLCLHGEPSWGYLYRKMMPHFLGVGARVVVPDFFGFGRSDKPVEDGVYTFDFHRDSLMRFVERLDLRNITLVCQDWGGLLGLTLPMDMPERFARVLAMNTSIPVGQGMTPGFQAWRDFAGSGAEIPVAGLIALSSPGALNLFDLVAYDAPFPDNRYKAGVRRFPQLVPVEPDMDGVETGRRAREFFLNDWQGESFIAVGMRDVVLGKDAMEDLRSTIRGAPPLLEVMEAGHFAQEWGDEIAPPALRAFGLLT